MMDCKKALEENNGNMEQAIDWLRKKGLAAGAKKADRIAAEGIVEAYIHPGGRVGVLLEVNCETDFVARQPDFAGFADAVARVALASRPADVEALQALPIGTMAGSTVAGSIDETRRGLIAKIGENITVRRFVVVDAPTLIGAYLHGSRIGAVVAVEGGDAALAHDLAMHVAASNPQYVSAADVPADVLAKEREIETEKALGEGKPADIVAKMVEGRVRKSLNEIALLGQPFVKDPDTTIEKLLKGAKAGVKSFQRLEVGAGIEKKQDDFVGEVMAQVKASSKDTAATPPGSAH